MLFTDFLLAIAFLKKRLKITLVRTAKGVKGTVSTLVGQSSLDLVQVRPAKLARLVWAIWTMFSSGRL